MEEKELQQNNYEQEFKKLKDYTERKIQLLEEAGTTAVYAKAYLNSAQDLTNDGYPHKILIDTAAFTASNITFGSNKFTITKAGKYLIIAKLDLTNVGDNGSVRVRIYKNGGLLSDYRNTQSLVSGTNSFTNINSGVFSLAANDYIEFYASSSDGGTYTIQTGEGNTEMSLIKI